MRYILAIGMAFFTAATVFAQSATFPTEGQDKGTIGIVCVDNAGRYHVWNSRIKAASSQPGDNRTDFESCVDEVVSVWTATCSSSPSDVDGMVKGLETYRQSYERAAAASRSASLMSHPNECR